MTPTQPIVPPGARTLSVLPREQVKLPKRSSKGEYDDRASLRGRRFIPDRYGAIAGR